MYFRHNNTKKLHLLTLMNIKGKKYAFEMVKDGKPSFYPIKNINLFNDKVLVHFTKISKEEMEELKKEIFPEPLPEPMVEDQVVLETT